MARFGDGQSAAVEILHHPSFLERDVEERGSERAADVRPPLAPGDAGVREADVSAFEAGRGRSEALRTPFAAVSREVVRLIRTGRQPTERLKRSWSETPSVPAM
jgi:hypothetical protein